MKARLRDSLAAFAGISLAAAYGLITRIAVQQDLWDAFLATVSLGFLLIVPLAAGALTVFLSPARLRASVLYALVAPWAAGLLFLIAVVLLVGELWICVVMASPIIFAMFSGGGLLGYALRGRRHDGTGSGNLVVVFLVAAPFLFMPIEQRFPPPTGNYSVTTSVVVAADPAIVWQNIVQVPEIGPEEQRPSFFHFLGVPRPLEARLLSAGLGGIRHGRFAGGLLFVERITDWQPRQHIRFEIEPKHTETVAPLDQIGGPYYDIVAAAYTIEPLADGGVRLHLTGDYSLTSHLNGYGRLWLDVIMSDFQSYVLRVVRDRSEAQARQAGQVPPDLGARE